MEIPKQLKKEKYRFTPIERKEKSPYEKGWQKNNNHKYNSKILQKHLKNGGNYGVIGGFGNLVIIDADKQEVANQIEKHLPETFTIQTGSGGYHYYYECSSLKNPIRLEENKAGDVGDVQGEGKQVVGPGSIHPNGNRYKIIKDKPIKKIDKENIKFALKNWIEIEEKNKIEQKNKEDYINLPLTDIIDTTNLKESGDEMYGKHPIHGSDTGRNFWINKNKNTWFCFRHNSGGSSLLWLAVKYGVIDCIDAQPGALEGNKYIETIEKADQNNILDAEDFLKREETAQLYKPPEKIQKKLENKNLWKNVIETTGETIKGDQHVREILLLTGISSYAEEPQNIFIEGRSSTGKTYNATEIYDLFPKDDVWYIGNMTPKSFIYDSYEWNEERGKRIVNMENRILVFLEPPERRTYELLRPLLSHDKEEIEYKATNSDKMKTESIIIKGYPASIFCSSKVEYIEDLATRGTTITPEIEPEKWDDANQYIGEINTKPWKKQNIEEKRQNLEKIIKSIRSAIIKHNLSAIVPYGGKLAETYESTKARDMRDFPRLLNFIKQSALFHCFQRPIIDMDGQKYVIAMERDYEIAGSIFLRTFEASQLGVPEDVLNFYKSVLVKSGGGHYDRLQKLAQKRMSIDLGGTRFKEKYIYPLLNNGLAVKTKDPDDGRRVIIEPSSEDNKLYRDTSKAKLKPFREFFSKKDAKSWLKKAEKNSPNHPHTLKPQDLSLNIINSTPPKFGLFRNGQYGGKPHKCLKEMGGKNKSMYFDIVSDDREKDNSSKDSGDDEMEKLGSYNSDSWSCDECNASEAEYSIPKDKENNEMLHLCEECYKEMGYGE